MLYFFLYYLPNKIITFISLSLNLNFFSEESPIRIVIYGLLGVILLAILFLIMFLLFRLMRLLWRRVIKHTLLGREIEDRLMPVFWGLDWKLVLLVFFSCEILMEYWKIFLPITVGFDARNFINSIYDFFFDAPNQGMKSLVIMLIYYIVSIIFYFVIPLLFLFGRQLITKDKYYLKYTFSPGKWKVGLNLILICWVFMLIVLFIAMAMFKELRELYPLGGNKALINNLGLFIMYEFGALFYFIAFEYFFRGPLFFEFEKKVGNYAILIMILPYIIHKFGKPSIEIMSAIIAGLALGVIAKWTRSFIYGALLHFMVSMSADVIASIYRTFL